VLQTLLTIDEGCEVITNQLDGLKEGKTSIEVNLGSGKLFDLDQPCNQARILSELMSVRNRTEQGRSLESLTALMKHPVLVVFIMEKWEKIKFAFFVHLRLWMMFLLVFSIFLRVEVNKQIDRKRFHWLQENENTSLPLCFDKLEECHFFEKIMKHSCNETAAREINITKICPKDPEFSKDSSRMVMARVEEVD